MWTRTSIERTMSVTAHNPTRNEDCRTEFTPSCSALAAQLHVHTQHWSVIPCRDEQVLEVFRSSTCLQSKRWVLIRFAVHVDSSLVSLASASTGLWSHPQSSVAHRLKVG